ncbi:c-type cytochrome [Siccirubricoccus phaeus]|uniref:c-type cytochrome n=1 Tax=Siccirubricoccus phaeus TaxID=2595053 RepID=UPI0011F40169|nr:cytochrome c [Siccirubricoccus phaeus]
MRRRWPWLLLAAGLAAGAALWWLSAPRPRFGPEAAAMFEQGDAARGRRLFAAGDCASCHASPGQPDRLRLGGGMALASPLGTFRPPNISPDPVDGIGRWSGVEFANALMAGVSPDGRHYYPALPYIGYARMRPEDVADLWAYLRTLPPVPGQAPSHDLAFPLTIRRPIGLWKLIYLEETPLAPDPAQDAAWNRGRYLVEAVAHCAECHGTRNMLLAVKETTRLAGGPDQEGTGFVPNITPARLEHWSEADFVALLTTGRSPEGRVARSSMADVVLNTASLPEADRAAIARYLKSQPARETPRP